MTKILFQIKSLTPDYLLLSLDLLISTHCITLRWPFLAARWRQVDLLLSTMSSGPITRARLHRLLHSSSSTTCKYSQKKKTHLTLVNNQLTSDQLLPLLKSLYIAQSWISINLYPIEQNQRNYVGKHTVWEHPGLRIHSSAHWSGRTRSKEVEGIRKKKTMQARSALKPGPCIHEDTFNR